MVSTRSEGLAQNNVTTTQAAYNQSPALVGELISRAMGGANVCTLVMGMVLKLSRPHCSVRRSFDEVLCAVASPQHVTVA